MDREQEVNRQSAAPCARQCSWVCLEGSRAGSLDSRPSWEPSLQGGGDSDASAVGPECPGWFSLADVITAHSHHVCESPSFAACWHAVLTSCLSPGLSQISPRPRFFTLMLSLADRFRGHRFFPQMSSCS